MFDLDADPGAIAHSLSRAALLADSIRERPGLRIPGAWEPFEAIVRAIVGQQISVSAATTICGRLVERFG
jgi:3-methyladenine DNA glycosylase/8-oxoguanine DNA glycosylase